MDLNILNTTNQRRVFRAVIENAGGGGAYVIVPFDVEKVFGKIRVKVKATFDGEPYRGTLVRMGGPKHILGVLKEIREKISKSFGDEVEIVIEEDTEPREVIVPSDFLEAIKSNPDAETTFKSLSYTHQKEYVRWIEDAKREQTRKIRIDKAIETLKKGKKG